MAKSEQKEKNGQGSRVVRDLKENMFYLLMGAIPGVVLAVIYAALAYDAHQSEKIGYMWVHVTTALLMLPGIPTAVFFLVREKE